MAKNLDRKLVGAVSDLLCQRAATHPDFFLALAEEMTKRHYHIEAHQRGILGTHVTVVYRGTMVRSEGDVSREG